MTFLRSNLQSRISRKDLFNYKFNWNWSRCTWTQYYWFKRRI